MNEGIAEAVHARLEAKGHAVPMRDIESYIACVDANRERAAAGLKPDWGLFHATGTYRRGGGSYAWITEAYCDAMEERGLQWRIKT